MMRHRSSTHQPPVADIVTLPDVGPMSRQELRQLEAALYGHGWTAAGRRRQDLDEESRAAEGSAIAARRSALRPSRSRRVLGNSTAASTTASGFGNAVSRSRSSASEVSQAARAQSASEPSAPDQLDVREREHHLRHLLDLEGPLGSVSAGRRLSGSSITGNSPSSSSAGGSAATSIRRSSSSSAAVVSSPSASGAPRRAARSSGIASASANENSPPTAAAHSSSLAGHAARDSGARERTGLLASSPALTANRTNRQPRNSDEIINVPDVGRISRSQLSNLEAVLDGRSDVDAALANLPDLRGMNSRQLQQLEAALSDSREADNSTVAIRNEHQQPESTEIPAESARSRRPGSSSSAAAMARPASPPLPPIAARSSDQRPVEARSTPTPARASDQRPADARPAPTAGQGSTPQTQKWRIVEEAFQKLEISGHDVPDSQECSICYQTVSSGAAALPCSKHGCASFFHHSCIRPWLERNPTCPLCRSDLKEFVEPVPSAGPSAEDSMIMDLIAAGMGQWLSRHRAMMWMFRQRAFGGDMEDDAGIVVLPPWLLASLGEDDDMDPTAFLIAAMAQHASLAANDMQLAGQQRVPYGHNARGLLEGADLVRTLGRANHGVQAAPVLVTAAELLGYSAPLSDTGLVPVMGVLERQPPSLSSGTSRQRTSAAHSPALNSQGSANRQPQTSPQSMPRSASLPQLDHAARAADRRRML